MGGCELDTPKKVLIFYASAGHGHEKAAQAILESFGDSGKLFSVRAIDTLSIGCPLLCKFYRQVYFFQLKYVPWLWGMFYYSFDMPLVYFFMKRVRRILNTLMAKDLEKLLISENPDVVICTHFTAIEVTSNLKKKNKIRPRLVAVVTDYMPHYVWTASEVDQYVVALEETRVELARRGADLQRINVLGIPIEKKFLVRPNRSEIIRKLGLNERFFTVLVTSGGAGIGAIQNIVEGLLVLRKPLQMLVVCGSNKNLRMNLEVRASVDNGLRVFGFVDNMHELMEASDLVVGKAGGLTITESFCAGKPVILFQSVPGQEARNAELVRKQGAGFVTDQSKQVVEKIVELSDSPQKMESLKKGIAAFAKPSAGRDIVQLVENGF